MGPPILRLRTTSLTGGPRRGSWAGAQAVKLKPEFHRVLADSYDIRHDRPVQRSRLRQWVIIRVQKSISSVSWVVMPNRHLPRSTLLPDLSPEPGGGCRQAIALDDPQPSVPVTFGARCHHVPSDACRRYGLMWQIDQFVDVAEPFARLTRHQIERGDRRSMQTKSLGRRPRKRS